MTSVHSAPPPPSELGPDRQDRQDRRQRRRARTARLWDLFDASTDVAADASASETNTNTTAKTDTAASNSDSGSGPGFREQCDQCRGPVVFTEEGFLACTNPRCGLMFKDVLDSAPEWRFYSADDHAGGDPTRCGMPINPLLAESSYGIKVLCTGKMSYEMRKIKRYAEWQSAPYKEKAQYNEFQRIITYANNAGISKKIIDDAIRYHKKLSDHSQTFRGVNRDGILAASIYISCRINGYPRTAREIASIFYLDTASATQGCKNAQVILNVLEKDLQYEDKTVFGRTKPSDFIERFCSRLSMNQELTKVCLFIAHKVDRQALIPENTPDSVAAGIVFFVAQLCNMNISRREVKVVSEISEVTINKCCKKLRQMTEQLVPSVIVQKYAT